MTDFRLARENMVESQVRPNGITDRRIIDAMASIAREDFLPRHKRELAYVDDDIEIAPAADGLPRTLYAGALAQAGRADEARALLRLWPLPDSPGDPVLQSLLYPKFLELRKSLGVK